MSKFDAFKLRLSLLRIWFFKNIIIFLEVLFFIGLVLVFTGQITEDTPVVGVVFGELSIAIREVLTQRYSDDLLVNSITTVLTLLVTIGMLSTNLKRIALSDIKSRDLKKALIQAGLYFNQDGKLVKRLEEATNTDIDGDKMIGDSGVTIDELPKERLLPSLKRAGDELVTIMTLKIEKEEHVEEIKEKADLVKTEKALDEVRNAAIDSAEKVLIKDANSLVKKKMKEPNLLQKASVKVTSMIKDAFVSLRGYFANRKEMARLSRIEKAEKKRIKLEAKNKAKMEKKQKNKNKPVQPIEPVPQQKTLSRQEEMIRSRMERRRRGGN